MEGLTWKGELSILAFEGLSSLSIYNLTMYAISRSVSFQVLLVGTWYYTDSRDMSIWQAQLLHG